MFFSVLLGVRLIDEVDRNRPRAGIGTKNCEANLQTSFILSENRGKPVSQQSQCRWDDCQFLSVLSINRTDYQ